MDWKLTDLGDWHGKRVIVTGANSGIGYYTALELGRAGADVVIGCRDAVRGEEALHTLAHEAPQGSFRLETLDLADLSSVRRFAEMYLSTGKPLDLLVNNAGIMMPPTRELTKDGFEMQLGTNHLGHFALTGLLLPALKLSAAPRVVTVSSVAATQGKIAFDDLQSEEGYRPMRAYCQSKLANLAFMLELGRREAWLSSVAAHPGGTKSNLQRYAFGFLTNLFGQETPMGALPTLRAASESAPSGSYFGPKHLFHMRGVPVKVDVPKRAHHPEMAQALWAASEELTGIHY